MYRYCLVVKGLTPKSELHLISFENITHESNILNLTRTKGMLTSLRSSWLLNIISLLTP